MVMSSKPTVPKRYSRRKIQKTHRGPRGKTGLRKPGFPPRSEVGGVHLFIQRGRISLRLGLSFRSRDLWTIFLLATLVLLLLASSVSEDLRNFFLGMLLGMLRLLIMGDFKAGL